MGLKFLNALDEDTLDMVQKDWRGGADEFSTPTMLPPSTGGRLLDALVEDNGRPRTRPGADALGGAALDAGQRIEALTYFDTPLLERVFAAINLSLRTWDGAAWATLAGYPFGVDNIKAMAQGHNRLYASSAAGQWYSHDGTNWNAGEGTGANDPPVGASLMVWHTALNRMFAAGTIGGNYDVLAASRLDNASAGSGKWDAANWQVRVGRGEGERITALCPGKGFWLCVGKEGSLFMVYADPAAASAAEWEIPRLAGSVGCLPRAMVAAGDSVFVLGPDLALREIIPTAAAVRTGDVPFELGPAVSEPAKPYFDRINRAALDKIVLHKYGRYLFCALPLDSATEASHVCVWNLRLRQIAPGGGGTIPVFTGVWSGWTPTVLATSRFAGVERLLIGDSAGCVNQWKDGEDQTDPDTFADNGVDVLATVRAQSWDYGSPRNYKDPESVDVAFINSEAPADIVVVLDDAEQPALGVMTERVQNELPVNLPFDLAVQGTVTATLQIDHFPEFREQYVEVRQTARGRLEVKSIAASAFANTQSQQ